MAGRKSQPKTKRPAPKAAERRPKPRQAARPAPRGSATRAAGPLFDGIERLHQVAMTATNLDASVAFYRDVVGLPLIRRAGDEWAEFDAGAVRLALHGAVHGHAPPPGGATAVFLVDDLDDARGALTARGVTFGHEGGVEGYARFLAFADPDGNTVQIIEYEPGGD